MLVLISNLFFYESTFFRERQSRFTHNDETRILVRSKNQGEDTSAYRTEYIYGILSPEVNLFIMLYEKGPRGHEVQKRIFEDSNIMAFLADRCMMYHCPIAPAPETGCVLGPFPKVSDGRYLQDKRLEPMAHLLARLFAAEKIISNIRNLTETERVRERQRMCRPLVEAMFRFMEKVRAAGTDYGVLARRAADYLLDDREVLVRSSCTHYRKSRTMPWSAASETWPRAVRSGCSVVAMIPRSTPPSCTRWSRAAR